MCNRRDGSALFPSRKGNIVRKQEVYLYIRSNRFANRVGEGAAGEKSEAEESTRTGRILILSVVPPLLYHHRSVGTSVSVK